MKNGQSFDLITVNGMPVQDLNKAVEAYKYMKSNPTLNEPDTGASADGDKNNVKCDVCGKDFDLDTNNYVCPHCGADHTQCPGCDGWYEATRNTDDHCPLCGYSSWGDDEDDKETGVGTGSHRYVLRIGPDKWIMTDYDEKVGENVKNTPHKALTAEEALKEAKRKLITLITDNNGRIKSVSGKDLTLDDLESMEEYTSEVNLIP